jgi:hypothetical protein
MAGVTAALRVPPFAIAFAEPCIVMYNVLAMKKIYQTE